MTQLGYPDLERIYGHVFSESAKRYAQECKTTELALSFSFATYFNLASRLSTRPGDERAKLLAVLFYRNCVYLSAAYQMCRRGMLDPAGNNLRTVFETIIWQYAYLLDDGAYRAFCELGKLEEEKFRLLLKSNAKNYGVTSNASTGPASAFWSNTKERTLENLRRKNNFQKVMKSLYSKDVFEQFFSNPYWVLCQKAHSSTFGINYNTPNLEGKTTMEKRPEELRDTLTAVLYLCAENLVCFLNCFAGHYDEDAGGGTKGAANADFDLPQAEVDAVLSFTNKINAVIPPARGLVPDKHQLKFTIKLREVQ